MTAASPLYGIFICAALVIAAVALLPFPAAAASDVSDISYWSYADYTRIVISLSDKVEFTKNRLSDPDRLYFDLQNSSVKQESKAVLPVGNGMLKSIRAAQFDKSTVRVVLDLQKIKDYSVSTIEDPVRIIIDVYGYATKPVSTKKKIVIDAGHGGHDPGAIGPNKLYEKDVVLDIALKLKKILSQNPDLEVYLTRDRDVYLKLEERTAIANSKKADLFLSIHANSSPKSATKGIETYFLNWTDDDEAMKVAARENRISVEKMRSMKKQMNVLDLMLDDLRRDNKREESLKLAHTIQQALVTGIDDNNPVVVDHGVKWALFYVLFRAKMPAVLAEVSFISNPVEERLLSRDGYRKDLAKSLADGITKYLAASSDQQNFASVRHSIDFRD
jgi:N-acetylmuramoyl-L-alanine amidase